MKYIFLAIFVLLATQPFQASSCDMHDAQETNQGHHAGMLDDGAQDMDCCDHDPADPSDNCDSMSHCGASSAVVTIETSPLSIAVTSGSKLFIASSKRALNRTGTPPFRPPIV